MLPIEVEILLPVHNEGPSIEATVRGIYAEVSSVARCGFIVCEDGSRDDTQQVLRGLAHEFPMRLNLSAERKGYSRAVREGMGMLEANYLLCLDSDGQCDPTDFVKLWESRGEADIVMGWRRRRADTLTRIIFSGLFYRLYQVVFHVPVHDPSCPFILLPREVAQRLGPELVVMREGFWWEFVARAHRRGYTIREIEINHRQRVGGTTQVYGWRRMPGIFARHVWALGTVWRQTR